MIALLSSGFITFFFLSSYSVKYFYIFLKLVSRGLDVNWGFAMSLPPVVRILFLLFLLLVFVFFFLVNVNLCDKENKLTKLTYRRGLSFKEINKYHTGTFFNIRMLKNLTHPVCIVRHLRFIRYI